MKAKWFIFGGLVLVLVLAAVSGNTQAQGSAPESTFQFQTTYLFGDEPPDISLENQWDDVDSTTTGSGDTGSANQGATSPNLVLPRLTLNKQLYRCGK